LSRDETEHALRVLRLGPGDGFEGLDGRGRSWPIRVESIDKQRAVLACVGEPRTETRAGEPGAALPWIEIALVLPRGGRAEEIVNASTQLGVAAIQPLSSERAHPEARQLSTARAERLGRVTQEACKQSGRLWLPVLLPLQPLGEWLAARATGDTLVLAPKAGQTLSQWLDQRLDQRLGQRFEPRLGRADWAEASPLCVVVGPEGGFAPAEETLLGQRSAARVSLGPHTLRIETAALAALAIVAERAFSARRT
jgi:16S rRNA (uracil1498-N3)-methyltransferase